MWLVIRHQIDHCRHEFIVGAQLHHRVVQKVEVDAVNLSRNLQRPAIVALLRPRLASGGEIARVEIEDVLVLDAVLGRAAGLQIP